MKTKHLLITIFCWLEGVFILYEKKGRAVGILADILELVEKVESSTEREVKQMAKGMNKNKVLKLLELFPEIDGEIKSRRSFISDLEQYYNPIQGVGYSDTTKGKYANSAPTERLALNIPEYVRGDIQRYQREIEELQKVKVEILKEVSRLTMKQKNVVFGYYFHGMKWEEVAERTHYSERQCKNIRDGAVERLLKGFENNRILSEYEIKE